MIIGVNTLSILPGENGGGETYLVNLLENLSKIDKNNQYRLFVNKGNYTLFPETQNFTKVFCPVSKRNVALRVLWEQISLPFYIIKNKIDVLFSPANMSPVLWCPCKSVLTIHDLIWLQYGKSLSKMQFLMHKYLTFRSAIKADIIMADSDYTKKDILNRIKTNSNKISVVHLGVGKLLRGDCNYTNNKLLEQIGSKYLLSVGRTHPHKNFVKLLEAYKVLRKKNNFNCKLVIAGLPGMQQEQLKNKIINDNLEREAFLLCNVSNDDLGLLYKNAELFVFPSLYEGFGLPILEAMSFGLPVVSSSSTCLPEIGGGAALYFDPLDIDDMADKIYAVLSSEDLKRELIKNGRLRIQGFTWAKTAQETLELMGKVCK